MKMKIYDIFLEKYFFMKLKMIILKI